MQTAALYKFSEEFTLHDLNGRYKSLIQDRRVQTAARDKLMVSKFHADLRELSDNCLCLTGIPGMPIHAKWIWWC